MDRLEAHKRRLSQQKLRVASTETYRQSSTVCGLQVVILMLFNDVDSLSLADMRGATGIEDKEFPQLSVRGNRKLTLLTAGCCLDADQ